MRQSRVSRARFAVIVLVTIGLASAPAPAVSASPLVALEERSAGRCDDACWLRAVARYAADPVRQLRRFVALGRARTSDVPAVALLALGDANLRAGQTLAAAELFREAIACDLGDPWQAWASLGLAWSSVAHGENGVARATLQPLVERGGDGASLAAFLLAMLDAVEGAPHAAGERFAAIRDDDTRASDVRAAAALGVAYAAAWEGDHRRAHAAFDDITTSGPGVLRDDARYGAALASLRAGDAETARTELEALAGEDRGGAAVSRALLELEPRALLERGFETYRRGRLEAPEQRTLRLLDADGAALARALLRRLARKDTIDEPPTPGRASSAVAGHATARDDERPDPAEVDAPRAAEHATPSAPPVAWRTKEGVAVVLATIAVLGLRRRLRARRPGRTT